MLSFTILGLVAFLSPSDDAAALEPSPFIVRDDEEDAELKELEELINDPFKAKVRQRKDDLDKTYGQGFFTYICDDGVMPRPYLVAAQTKDNVDLDTITKEYSDILGSLYEVFFAEFGAMLDLDPIMDPVVVLIYDSRDAYKEMRESRPELGLLNEEFVAGYYSPADGVLTQWRQSNLWEVMFHEGTHQLVDYATKKWNFPQWKDSPWFQEGFADFMGGHERKLTYSEEKEKFVNEFTLGQFIKHRYAHVQQAMNVDDALSVHDLVHLDFITFKAAQNNQEGDGQNQRLTGLVYSQGWALVMFLNYYEGDVGYPKYREDFHVYMQAETRGEGGGAKFGEIFLLESEEDWADFDREYREYVYSGLRQLGVKSRKR